MTGDLPESFAALSSMANMTEGNSWSSGPAPPPLPGTPPSSSSNRNRKQNDNKNSSDGGGSKKSGIGGGGVAGIVISILVVGAVVAFFVVKKRSEKSSADVENAGSQPFTSYASQEVQVHFVSPDGKHIAVALLDCTVKAVEDYEKSLSRNNSRKWIVQACTSGRLIC
ncbi:hypothetical protein DCAR_0102011 [Daucus carota subsp. sativus]|uniref:Uncharacterized protein n=1 Tax=Daucus carota subsp. sativus TaxID=79200 RepID=A0A166GT83_DAUCS|nr:hypothetical protein DCAR_0102011 [Daucus carota subsp. sativus]